ncbi:MAG: response regulator [Proteobacteria bacterium]|nr:response regulator [Pseudomonadota bacterium]
MNSTLQSGRPAEILLVEDNENDIELTKIGFEQSRLAANLHCVLNGEECMAFLRKESPYVNVPTPDIILLDLNMPKMDGREVLEEVSKDDSLKRIPIIVLTTSKSEFDVLTSYDLHCNSYIIKPVGFEQFSKVIRSLSDYWFTLVVLPSKASESAKIA